MAYQPAADERLLLGPRSGSPRGDMIFIPDLAEHLNVGVSKLTPFARKLGFLRRARLVPDTGTVHWVTPYAASRLIAYFRAIQGALAFDGVDHGELTEKMRAKTQRLRRIQSGALNKR